MIGLNKDIVKLVPYDKSWAEEFEKEKKIIAEILKDDAIDIQHVGSTSIPGISAKPIIDIAVGVKDKETLYKLLPIMSEYGYDCKDSIESELELLAAKGGPENRTHYIHIELYNGKRWLNHILFRDYLLDHTEYIKQYEDLKKEIFKNHPDRASYTPLKSEFINTIINKAKEEKGIE